MCDELIIVDEFDKATGTGEKYDIHRKGILHRAFSLFIFDNSSQKVLLQQRALTKYHSGGLWTNSCCSHPRKNEKTVDAVLRRTSEELGVSIPKEDISNNILQEIGVFKYYKDFGDCIEHEIDHVFIWLTSAEDTNTYPNDKEIEELKWISIGELDN